MKNQDFRHIYEKIAQIEARCNEKISEQWALDAYVRRLNLRVATCEDDIRRLKSQPAVKEDKTDLQKLRTFIENTFNAGPVCSMIIGEIDRLERGKR